MASDDYDAMLAEDMAAFFDDPLGFVMYAFDWDNDPALQICELVEPWASRYDSRYGPDEWACRMFDDIGEQCRQRGFDGKSPVLPQRHAVSSGHGIGKSAFTAMLCHWIMSTRPFCKGVVTANTAEQLASKTWAEIAKWNKRCITGHWFSVTTGKGAMRMTSRQYPEAWRLDAQTCREENSESFAGLHAANSSPFYIFDEASAVPDKIWEVAEGGMTDGEPFWFVFGNPTRNTGRFFECFNKLRHRWSGRQIDSRTVQITNKQQIQQWVDDEGEDSDFVRVRVRGVFPRASSLQFIPRDLVDDAALRKPAHVRQVGLSAAVGVDVARFGDDQSCIATRVGRDASWPLKRFGKIDTMQLASKVLEHVRDLKQAGLRPVVFVDGGGVGGGVVDRLRQLNLDAIEVQFGGKPDNSRKYANKRAEMWGAMKEWLKTGSLPKDQELVTDLTSPEYSFRPDDTILLEPKEAMKRRGLASPDAGDALALTFAYPVEDAPGSHDSGRNRQSRDYDPMALI